MTYHGTSWASMQNAIGRAKGRADKRLRSPKLRFKKIRHPQAYRAAVAEAEEANVRHGIEPVRLTKAQRLLRFVQSQHQQHINRQRQLQPAIIDERQEAAMLMTSIVHRAVDSLLIGLRRMLTAPGDSKIELPMAQKEAIYAVGVLCDLVGRARPDFALERKPGVKPQLDRCENCGLMLRHDETGPFCSDCDDMAERRVTLRQAREQLEARENEIAELYRLLKEMEDYARHGGDSRENAASVGAIGRGQNYGDSNSPAHRHCADNLGDFES